MELEDKQNFADNIIKELLNNKGKNYNRIPHIIELINQQEPDIINLTISDNFKGQKVNIFGAAIMYAPELVNHLINNQYPIDFNWQNNERMTLLSILAKNGHLKLSKENINYLIERCKHLVDITHNGHNVVSYALTSKNVELANKLLPFYKTHWAKNIKTRANNILRDNLMDNNLDIIEFYAKTAYPFINDSDIKQKVDYIHSSSHYNKKSFFDYIRNNRNNENNFFDNVLPLFFKMEFDPNIYFNNKDATFSLSRLIHSNNYNFNNIKQFLSIMPEFKESDKDKAFYLNAIFDKIDNKNDFFNLNLDKIHYKILTPIDFVLQHFTFCHNKKNGYNIINNCMDIIIDLFQNKKFIGSQTTYDYMFIHYPTNNLQPKTEIKINENSVKTVYQSFIDNINNLNLYYYSDEEKKNIFNKFEILLSGFMKDKKIILKNENSKEPDFINIYHRFYEKNQLMSESTFNIFSNYLKRISLPVELNETFNFIMSHASDEQLTSLVKNITKTPKQKLTLYSFYIKERREIYRNQYKKIISDFSSEDIKFLINNTNYEKTNLEQLYLKRIAEEKQELFNHLNSQPKQPKKRL